MNQEYDVLIVGSGVAGLNAALKLPRSCKTLVICKRELSVCNSSLAQGGIAAVYHNENDNIQLHKNDTMIAGGFKNNPDTVEILVKEAEGAIDTLLECGVDFDKDEKGELHRTLEGGHCRNRIFHYKDETGKEMVQKLHRAVKELPNVTIWENALMTDIKKIGSFYYAQILQSGNYTTIKIPFVIFGTGGIGRLYERTTNSAIATGDGIGYAYMMGARVKNLSYIQFHPTAFKDEKSRECFLISESVRGEGAYLLNCKGERFMHKYDDRLELAPRDVVSHSIIMEERETGSSDFYLDISHEDANFLYNRFPLISGKLKEYGIDMAKDRIPIYPCQHYLMGGIAVDEYAQSTLDGLYAVGECSNTGVHGGNRLASNSLLEAMVFSERAANQIADRLEHERISDDGYRYDFPVSKDAPCVPTGIRTELRQLIQKNYFVVPNRKKATECFSRVAALKTMLCEGDFQKNADYVEARSLATAAYIILKEIL